jgi:hypothetical protein
LGPSGLDHCDELIVRHRPTEYVALHEVAVQSRQLLSILAGLNADGNGIAIEVMGNLDHALADIRIARIACATLHERRIYLDLGQIEISEQRE